MRKNFARTWGTGNRKRSEMMMTKTQIGQTNLEKTHISERVSLNILCIL